MPRYKLTIEYCGAGFVGWQRQPNGLSIQEALETALRRFCGESLTVFGAGRTDAGVHALAQVAHVDLPRAVPPDEIRGAVNHHLKPHAISVLAVEPVSSDFDARLSATGRRYLYRILNRRAPPALDRGRVWHVAPPLDVGAMREGAAHLIGHHDFSTFRDSLCQARSPVKTLDALEVTRDGDEIHIAARPLVSAPSGAQHGRHAEAGRARPLAARRRGPRARRPRPPRRRADRSGRRAGAGRGAL